jgi:23S rRNA (guanine745-N1)-methyltransferase
VIDSALAMLRCPRCKAGLARDQGVVRCAQGHAFDLARQGYLNLTSGGQGAGDTAAMVAARERFLGGGHFDPLGALVAEQCELAAPSGAGLVELGAGTAWYLARALDRRPDATGLALDISKPALRRAARAHPRVSAVACDAWGPLPVRDAAAAVALSVFAPRNASETARILGSGGVLAVVTPAPRHLTELVAELGLLTVDDRKQERLRDQLSRHFDITDEHELEWTLRLDHAAVRDAVGMGPSAFHAPGDLDARIAALPEPLAVTASVRLSLATRLGR